MAIQLSLPQARRIALHSQLLFDPRSRGKGAAASLTTIEHLGYVQIDTLTVVERAHHHTLWNRLGQYRLQHIDQLQREGRIFEHWAHALAYLPMQNYRFSLPMMQRIAGGETHWSPKDEKETKKVLARIRAEGPLTAKDFKDKKTSKLMWARSASKRALEQLFIEGELMIPHRLNFQKVYDLRERVLPDDVDTRTPSTEELARHLITNYLRAHGFGKADEIAYQRKGMGPAVRQCLNDMVEEQTIVAVQAGEQQYFCTPTALELADKSLSRNKVKILSPFDNAIIQRKRIGCLFDYDYQIECYTVKHKRRYGYFCLPVLWNGDLVARFDAKSERQNNLLHVLHLHIEKPLRNMDLFLMQWLRELKRFATFNGCDKLQVHRISHFEKRFDQGIVALRKII